MLKKRRKSCSLEAARAARWQTAS